MRISAHPPLFFHRRRIQDRLPYGHLISHTGYAHHIDSGRKLRYRSSLTGISQPPRQVVNLGKHAVAAAFNHYPAVHCPDRNPVTANLLDRAIPHLYNLTEIAPFRRSPIIDI